MIDMLHLKIKISLQMHFDFFFMSWMFPQIAPLVEASDATKSAQASSKSNRSWLALFYLIWSWAKKKKEEQKNQEYEYKKRVNFGIWFDSSSTRNTHKQGLFQNSDPISFDLSTQTETETMTSSLFVQLIVGDIMCMFYFKMATNHTRTFAK